MSWEKVDVSEILFYYEGHYFDCPKCNNPKNYIQVFLKFKGESSACPFCKTKYRLIWHVEKEES